MNPKTLAILTLAAHGIEPKLDPNAGAFHQAMVIDCLPYYRQLIDAEIRQKATYEAQAQDADLSERNRQYARGLVEAIVAIDAEIAAYEQDAAAPNIPDLPALETLSPFMSFHVYRLYAPPPPDSPYFCRESVQKYLPYDVDVWMRDEAIGDHFFRLWLNAGRRNRVHANR